MQGLGTLCAFPHLIISTASGGWHNYPHFIDKEAEAQWCNSHIPKATQVKELQHLESKQVPLTLKASLFQYSMLPPRQQMLKATQGPRQRADVWAGGGKLQRGIPARAGLGKRSRLKWNEGGWKLGVVVEGPHEGSLWWWNSSISWLRW